jgi:cofilin
VSLTIFFSLFSPPFFFLFTASATFEEFTAALPEKDCRYAVYDFEWDQGADGKRTKVLFVVWAPDVAPIKAKMLYTSTKSSVKQKLVGIGAEIQATDMSEISLEEVLDKVTRGGTTA